MGASFGQSTFMLRGSAVPIANVISMMQQQVGRPVIDKTELTGLYDFVLRFSPEGLTPFGALSPIPHTASANSTGWGGAWRWNCTAAEPLPSIFTALQELGLRLESTKGPVEVFVIDSVQKPTEN